MQPNAHDPVENEYEAPPTNSEVSQSYDFQQTVAAAQHLEGGDITPRESSVSVPEQAHFSDTPQISPELTMGGETLAAKNDTPQFLDKVDSAAPLVPAPEISESFGNDEAPQKKRTLKRAVVWLKKHKLVSSVLLVIVLAIFSGIGFLVYAGIQAKNTHIVLHASSASLSNGAVLVQDSLASENQAVSLPNIPTATTNSATTVSTLTASLPEVKSTDPVYMSTNTQAPPTNRWFSSLAFYHDNSMAVFAQPLSLKTTTNGFTLGATRIVGTTNTVYDSASPDIKVSFSKATWNFVNSYDDMMVKADFKADDTLMGSLTLTHGSPYAFVNLPNGGAAAISGDAIAKVKDNYYTFTTNNVKYGVAWDADAVKGVVSNGGLTFSSSKLNGLVTIVAIPSGMTADTVYPDALNQITGTTVTAAKDGSNWKTTFAVSTQNGGPTLFGLLPNESKNVSGVSGVAGTFDSLYGKMSVYRGNQFVSSTAVSVPASSYDAASFTSAQKATLTPQVKSDIANLSFPAPDTYFGGKALAKGAMLYELATQLGLTSDAKIAHDKLMAEFAVWFDPNGCKTRATKCFIYDPNLHSVVGQEFAFGDDDINDHHFHYGYWLDAGAIIAKYDPSFVTTYGASLDMLAKDYANTDRSSTVAPYIRNFDLYTGHSWAAGLSPFADGNNQESSSEGVNAYYGLYQWASASGNSSLANTALWLYDRESAAATSYYTNIDKTNTGYSNFSAPFVSMLWGGKRDYATWFSAAGEAKLAIQVLPLTPASMYLGADKARVKSNLAAAAPTPTAYKDILIGYLALADPSAAQAQATALSTSEYDDGDTVSNLQAFIYYSQSQSAASKTAIKAATCSVNTSGASAAAYSVSVDSDGTYVPWVSIRNPNGAASVAVQVDGGCPTTVSSTGSSYTWIGTSNGVLNTVNLSAGKHTITLFGLAKGTRVDGVSLVSDLTCTPTGSDGTCAGSVPAVEVPVSSDDPIPPAVTTPVVVVDTPTPTSTTTSPSNLHVAGSTASSITLAWDGSTTGSYDILRAGVKIATVKGTSYVDSGLIANNSYAYSVRGNNVTTPVIAAFANSGDTSTTGGSSSGNTTAPAATTVSNLHVVSKTTNTISLAWDGSLSGSYDVLRSGVKIDTVKSTKYVDSGLIGNTEYIYSVRLNGVTTPQITVTTP